MAQQPFWVGEDEAAWDFCWLGGDLLPGISTVTVEKVRGVDVKKSKGQDGPQLDDTGYDPAKVTISIRIWTREQWEAWQRVKPKIDPQKAGGLRRPLEIVHPEANGNGVQTIYVTRIAGTPPTARSGKVETIEALQWFPKPRPVRQEQRPAEGDGFDATGFPIPQAPPAESVF